MDLNEEKSLIERVIRQNDAEAFGKLYDQYYDQIFAYALKRTGDYQAAQDITSEVFYKALSKLWQFKWRDLRLSSWLYKIAHNEIANHYRKASKVEYRENEELDVKSPHPTPEQEMIEAQDELDNNRAYQAIKKHVNSLPAKYQEVIALRYYQNKKVSEIAQILGKKEGTVKSLLSRAIDILEEKMRNES